MTLEQELVDEIQRIRLRKPMDTVTINNPTPYKLIGQGKQGVAFQLDEQRCVKVYFKKESLDRELHALQLGARAGICPRVYFWGNRYLVMEYIAAPTLLEYLRQNGLTKDLTKILLRLLDTFETIGFNRFDHSARHIFILPEEQIKVIDVVHIMKPTPVILPKKLLEDMQELAPDFLRYAEEISPKWSQRWRNHPDFGRMVARLEQKVLP